MGVHLNISNKNIFWTKEMVKTILPWKKHTEAMSKQVDNGLTRDLYTDLLYFQMILHSLPQSSIIWNQGQRAPQWWTWVTNHFSIDFKVF